MNLKNYITVENLSCKYGNMYGILIWGGDAPSKTNAIIDGCEISYTTKMGIYLGNYDDSIIKNCHVHHSQESHGVYIDGYRTDGTDNPILEHCEINNNNNKGIQLNSGAQYQTTNPIIRYNLIHDNAEAGLGDMSSDGGQYYYNIIYGVQEMPLVLHYATSDDPDHTVPCANAKVYNNVIIISNSTMQGIRVSAYSTGHIIKNNIIYSTGSETGGNRQFILKDVNGSATIDYNCYYKASYTNAFEWEGTTYSTIADWRTASSQGASDMATDPLMIDPANDDFTLQITSPCLNAGTNVSLTTDYAGNSVGVLPDIGAYEHQGVRASPGQNGIYLSMGMSL